MLRAWGCRRCFFRAGRDYCLTCIPAGAIPQTSTTANAAPKRKKMSYSTIEMFQKWNVTRALNADDKTRLKTLLDVWTWGNIIAQGNQTQRGSDDNLQRLNRLTGLDHDLQSLAYVSEAVRCWLFQAQKRGETVTINDVPREYIRGLCRRVRREELRLFCAAVWALNREGFTHPDQVAAAL